MSGAELLEFESGVNDLFYVGRRWSSCVVVHILVCDD